MSVDNLNSSKIEGTKEEEGKEDETPTGIKQLPNSNDTELEQTFDSYKTANLSFSIIDDEESENDDISIISYTEASFNAPTNNALTPKKSCLRKDKSISSDIDDDSDENRGYDVDNLMIELKAFRRLSLESSPTVLRGNSGRRKYFRYDSRPNCNLRTANFRKGKSLHRVRFNSNPTSFEISLVSIIDTSENCNGTKQPRLFMSATKRLATPIKRIKKINSGLRKNLDQVKSVKQSLNSLTNKLTSSTATSAASLTTSSRMLFTAGPSSSSASYSLANFNDKQFNLSTLVYNKTKQNQQTDELRLKVAGKSREDFDISIDETPTTITSSYKKTNNSIDKKNCNHNYDNDLSWGSDFDEHATTTNATTTTTTSSYSEVGSVDGFDFCDSVEINKLKITIQPNDNSNKSKSQQQQHTDGKQLKASIQQQHQVENTLGNYLKSLKDFSMFRLSKFKYMYNWKTKCDDAPKSVKKEFSFTDLGYQTNETIECRSRDYQFITSI